MLELVSDLEVDLVDLLVRQRPLDRSERYPQGKRFPIWSEFRVVLVDIGNLDFLDEISAHIADVPRDGEEVGFRVLRELKLSRLRFLFEILHESAFRHQHRNVLVDRRIGAHFLVGLEIPPLLGDPRVVAPEDPDIRDSLECHGESLESESESPSVVFLGIQSELFEDGRVHDSCSGHLKPFSLVHDFHFETVGGVGEMVHVEPILRIFSEERLDRRTQYLFQGILIDDFLLLACQPQSIDLVEAFVMSLVKLIDPVDLS